MEATICAYDPRDAADLADVFFRSVRQVALSDYTATQVRAWAPERRTAEWAHGEASDGRLVLVAANADDRPVAYIDLEPDGHIDRVFCAPEAAGQGIASRLYDAVEAAAREQGITSLFTEASELARRLFERKGFAVVERQDLVIRGVAIHNYRMAKPRSTGQIGCLSGVLTQKVPSELGEWELLTLPVPGSRGHLASAIVA